MISAQSSTNAVERTIVQLHGARAQVHLRVVLGTEELHRMVLGGADRRHQDDVGVGAGRGVHQVRVAISIDRRRRHPTGSREALHRGHDDRDPFHGALEARRISYVSLDDVDRRVAEVTRLGSDRG